MDRAFVDSAATTTFASADAGETLIRYVTVGWRPCRMEALEISVVVDPRLRVLERRLGHPAWRDFGTGPDKCIVGVTGTTVRGRRTIQRAAG